MRFLLLCLFIGTLLACNKPQQATYVVWKTSFYSYHNVADPMGYHGPWECLKPDSIGTHQDIYNQTSIDWATWKKYQENVEVTKRDTINHIVVYMARDFIISQEVKDIP